MFDKFLTHLSLRRSTAGVYYELRTLRQMAEIYFESVGLELPASRRSDATNPVVKVDVQPLTEEELAAKEAERIRYERLQGRDPGTTWTPDPER